MGMMLHRRKGAEGIVTGIPAPTPAPIERGVSQKREVKSPQKPRQTPIKENK